MHPYLHAPVHQITVDVAGAGGTGSLLLPQLVRLHRALIDRNLGGLHVRVFDPASVTEPNLVRQLFSPSDLHQNKAVVLTSRINRTFGTAWEAFPIALQRDWSKRLRRSGDRSHSEIPETANLTITCVDLVSARKKIAQLNEKVTAELDGSARKQGQQRSDGFGTIAFESWRHPLYWLDLGNDVSFGQAILGTWQAHRQPDGRAAPRLSEALSTAPVDGWQGRLPTVLHRYPALEAEEVLTTPSCSVAEALNKQDLTVNQFSANLGMTLLWDLFTQPTLSRCGAYFNLHPMAIAEVPVQPLTLAL